MSNVNFHIEKYLNDYFESKHNPKFGVLLQGEWGCGKTWFIKKFIDDYNKKSGSTDKTKFLYISLYSVESVNEIEDQIFQQLHPVLSSKPMALTGKILKGVLRSGLKINLDMANNTQGNIEANISGLNLPDFLKNTEDRILIFDDLERCLMLPQRTLGYINSFVEHQGLKVVIIANEDELENIEKKQKDIENDQKKVVPNYKKIKEKLIGKTFRVCIDVESAFNSFINEINNTLVKKFFHNSKDTIIDIFNNSNYNNLRNLKQSLWEFERIYDDIPDKYKKIPDLMRDLLSFFLIISFEIKKGKIKPSDIQNCSSFYAKKLLENANKKQKPTHMDEVFKKYEFFKEFDTILPVEYWKKLFDNGYLAKEEFEESLSKSKYCQDTDTPDWVKLWHHRDLEDDEFEIVLKKVKDQWGNREFKKPGLILHVAGLFLGLSEIGFYQSSKEKIVTESKKYIDDLKELNLLIPQDEEKFRPAGTGSWAGLGYAGQDTKEFKEISDYLISKINEIKIESLPGAGIELLSILSSDTEKFRLMIAPNAEGDNYHRIPILKYITPQQFLESLLKVKNLEKKSVAYALKARYESNDTAKALIEELDFLKNLRSEIDQEVKQRKGKISGYLLEFIKKPYLNDIIAKLEGIKTPSSKADKV